MWRNAATADALERALSRRSARREAEEALHPLLDLADELVSVGARGPALRPEFRRELHDRLLAAAAERAQQPSGVTATAAPVAPRRSAVGVEPLRAPVPVVVVLGRSWRHAAAGVLASALVAVGTTATASTGAMPGDALYTVKRGIEDVQLHLVTSEADLGQLHLHRAERRLQETRVLLGRGDGESAVRAAATLDEYENELAAGTGLLVAAHADGDDDALEVLDAFRQEREIELPSQPDPLAPVLEEDVQHLEDVIAGNGGVTADDGGPGSPTGTPDAGESPGDGGGAPAPSPTTSDGTPSDSPTAGPSGSGTSTTGQPTGSATGSGTGTATESGAGTPTGSGTVSATGSGTGAETGSGDSTTGSSTGTPTGPSSSPEASGTGSPAPGAGGVPGSGTTDPSSSGTPSVAGTGSPGTSSASDTTSAASQPPTATAPAEDDGTDVVAAPGNGPRPAPSPSAGTESTTASHAPSSTASSTTSNPDADPDGPAEGEDGTIQASDTPTGTATSTKTGSVDVG